MLRAAAAAIIIIVISFAKIHRINRLKVFSLRWGFGVLGFWCCCCCCCLLLLLLLLLLCFITKLVAAFDHADSNNKKKLAKGFPELFELIVNDWYPD